MKQPKRMNGRLSDLGEPSASYGDSTKPTKTETKADTDGLVERFKEEYDAGWQKDRDNQEEAYRDLRLIGDDRTEHWDSVALSERTGDGRPALIVNQVPQFIRQVTGDLRQMKPAIKVTPVNDAASKEVAAKVLPGMIRYIEQRSRAQQIYFSAADQQAGCGIGHWRVNHEYASSGTFEQEIRIEPIPDGIAVVWDCDAVLPDRSDAKYCFVPVDMARKRFEREYPGKSADSLAPNTPACFTAWFSDDHVRIAEWFYVDPEKKLLALYPDGAIDDVTDDDEAQALARAAGATLESRDGHCVYRALVSANEILEGPDKWPGPDIPIVPLIGEEIQIGRATVRRGVARVLRDVQRVYNYSISTKTELIALQPKSPWIGTDAQFEKYQDEWETANARNHPYLRYTNVPGVPPPGRVAPSVPTQSLDGLLIEMQGAMNATTGIYPAALGQKSNETSGRAIMARQREGDTGTFVYVANFQGALQRTGQIIVNMIPQIYDTARTIQITGEDGKIDEMPINQPGFDEEGMGPGIALNDVTVGAYQVAIEMGPSFSTKREEAREGMNELLRTLGPEGAVLFIDLLVKQMDWPLADKIAERAKFMLPPAIRMKEAQEAGEPPPEMPPPPPPSPEQQQAMQEEQQKNLEMARKNEIEEAKVRNELAKIELERQTQPEIARMQAQLQAEKEKTTQMIIEHEREIGTLQFEMLQLKQAVAEGPEKSEAQLAEDTQKNIEMARKSEIEDRRQQLEFRNMDREEQKAQEDMKRDEQQQAEIDDLKAHVAQLTNALIDMREVVGAVTQQADAAAQQQAQDPIMPALEQVMIKLDKIASRKQPTGVKRTKDGSMQVVYDETPPTNGATTP